MNIAVASGKGGTGKTTVCAALAAIWPDPVQLIDLDVEEPNLHLFLRPELDSVQKAHIEVPLVDEEKCTYCGACSELCQFKAITVLAEVVLTFPEMCHGCGGCMEVCPEDAVTWTRRELGQIESGSYQKSSFHMGRLRVGEAMSPPLIGQVLRAAGVGRNRSKGDVIMDCPPGVSCPAVAAVMESDVILLVSEPTPFGMYDFKLAYEAFTPLNKPMAAVINRAGLGDGELEKYCLEHDIHILAQIPFERRAAEAYAEGKLISQATPGLHKVFEDLAAQIKSWGKRELEAKNG